MVRTASSGCVPIVSPIGVVCPLRIDRPFFIVSTDTHTGIICRHGSGGSHLVMGIPPLKPVGGLCTPKIIHYFIVVTDTLTGVICLLVFVSTDTPIGIPMDSTSKPRIA